MIYLAQPYSHPDPLVRQRRYNAGLEIAAHYTKLEFLIYSPIVHYHEMANRYRMPTDFSFWRELNFGVLERCDEIWILPIKGWDESLGLAAERKFAAKNHKQITILHEDAKRLNK